MLLTWLPIIGLLSALQVHADELASCNPSDSSAMPTTSLALQAMTTSSGLPSSSTSGSIAVGYGSDSGDGGGEGKPPVVPPILPPGPGGGEGDDGGELPTDQSSDGPSRSVSSTTGSSMSSSFTTPTFSHEATQEGIDRIYLRWQRARQYRDDYLHRLSEYRTSPFPYQ